MIYSDKPCGDTYIWHSADEVKEFLELCCFSPSDLRHFNAKFVPDADRDILVEYFNDEPIEGSEDFFPKDAVCIPIHDPNPFFDDPQFPEPAFKGKEGVRKSEVALDENFWKGELFPYVAFVWFENSYDRMGNTDFEIASIRSMSQLETVSKLKEVLNSDESQARVRAMFELREFRTKHRTLSAEVV